MDLDGTADACHPAATGYTGSTGSQCDVFTEKCTVPYRDRKIKAVGYWVNAEMADELLDTVDGNGNVVKQGATEEVVSSWNQLMQNAAARAREVECRRTGGERASCHDAIFEAATRW